MYIEVVGNIVYIQICRLMKRRLPYLMFYGCCWQVLFLYLYFRNFQEVNLWILVNHCYIAVHCEILGHNLGVMNVLRK